MAIPARQTDPLDVIDDSDPDSPYYVPPVRHVTPEEGRALFDEEARASMGMSGEEFIRRYEAGEFDDVIEGSDHIKLIGLIMQIPFAR